MKSEDIPVWAYILMAFVVLGVFSPTLFTLYGICRIKLNGEDEEEEVEQASQTLVIEGKGGTTTEWVEYETGKK